MAVIASIRPASSAPNTPSGPGEARRLPATTASSTRPRMACLTGCVVTAIYSDREESCQPQDDASNQLIARRLLARPLPSLAERARSARGLRRIDHYDRHAGADQPAVHLAAHFLGDDVRIDGILDDRRPDEQDQFGPRPRIGLMREGVADAGYRIQQRNALPLLVLGLADEPCEQHGLAARDRDRALDAPLRYRGRQRSHASRGYA